MIELRGSRVVLRDVVRDDEARLREIVGTPEVAKRLGPSMSSTTCWPSRSVAR